MLDLQAVVNRSLERIIASETIEEAIHESLQKAIVKVVESSLSSYSEFGKALEAAVKESLQLRGDLDLPSYNQTILKIVRAQLQGATDSIVQQQIAGNLKRLLGPPRPEITLSSLVKEFISSIKERNSGGCVCYGETRIAFGVQSTDYGHHWLWLDEDAEKQQFNADIQLGLDKEGRVYSLRFRRQYVRQEIFAGPFYGFEEMLFQLHACGSRVVFDCRPDEIETTYYEHELV